MRHLADVIRQPLRWQQPGMLARNYELRSGSELVATLSFRSAFGTLARARSADGLWTFKRVGFWQTNATVREDGAPTDLACFRHNTWRGGALFSVGSKPPVLVEAELNAMAVLEIGDGAPGRLPELFPLFRRHAQLRRALLELDRLATRLGGGINEPPGNIEVTVVVDADFGHHVRGLPVTDPSVPQPDSSHRLVPPQTRLKVSGADDDGMSRAYRLC